MKIFSDLFKEKIKWTENELSALLSILTYQAKIDGNIDKEESKLIWNVIRSLPGEKPANWDDFIEKMNQSSQEHMLDTLKSMHSKKRKLVL